MTRTFTFSFLAAAIVLSVSCAGKRDTSDDAGALVEQIRQADLALLQAEEKRDLEGAMGFVAPYAVFQPPGVAPIVGQEAIRRFYDEQWFKLPFSEIYGEAVTIVVAASGDMAYLDGRSHLILEVSGEQVLNEGKYLGVWQRLEGQWRLVAISWTSNEPGR